MRAPLTSSVFVAFCFVSGLLGRASAQTPTAADPAWDAAVALKQKADYAAAAKAYDDYASANPRSPRSSEALVEAGVCWFSMGRARQKAQRATPESNEAFANALGYFDKVTKVIPTPSVAGRAQYMKGSTKMFLGDLVAAENEYSIAIDKFKDDTKYLPKSLERRACVRRGLLHTADAIADLARYQSEFPKGEDVDTVKRYAQYCAMFEKPAPVLAAETWVQGDPTTIEGMKGDVVVLYFFATWCENCEKARPFLIDLVERYEPMGVRFVGIVDHSKGQTVESVRSFLGPNKLRFPVIMDSGRTVGAYMGSKIPDCVILDRAGRVRWHDNPANLFDSTIEALLLDDGTSHPMTKPADKIAPKPIDKVVPPPTQKAPEKPVETPVPTPK